MYFEMVCHIHTLRLQSALMFPCMDLFAVYLGSGVICLSQGAWTMQGDFSEFDLHQACCVYRGGGMATLT